MGFSKINKTLAKIKRYCGYLLIFFICLYFISGYGMAKKIINDHYAKLLHEEWLPIPTFVAFLFHSIINIRFLLIRKGVKDKLWWDVYLIVLGIVLLAVFIYLYLL